MIIKDILIEATNNLKDNNIEDASIKAKILLAFVLHEQRQYLVVNNNKNIDDKHYNLYFSLINKLIEGVPLQYITNEQEFMKLKLFVNENVLIPQPDTEILVEEAIKIINNDKLKKVLDLCTGSGAIAISIAKNTAQEVHASDISKSALEIAKKNANLNNVKINFIYSDLFKNINEEYDIIVSNPPYIEKNNIKTLSKEVQSEPLIALDGGLDGLDFYREIAKKAYKYIKNNGYLCLEIGYNQKEAVTNILKKYKQYNDIYSIKDLAGKDRCIITKVRR